MGLVERRIELGFAAPLEMDEARLELLRAERDLARAEANFVWLGWSWPTAWACHRWIHTPATLRSEWSDTMSKIDYKKELRHLYHARQKNRLSSMCRL